MSRIDWTKWSAVAEIFSALAIVVTLVYLSVQTRYLGQQTEQNNLFLLQDQSVAESEVLSSETMIELEIARLVLENRTAWVKGLGGETLTADESGAFDLIAYSLFRKYANDQRRALTFQGTTVGNDRGIVQSYAFFLYENPGLRAWFDRLIESRRFVDRAFGLSDEVRFFPAFVLDELQRLDETRPSLPEPRLFPY